jgi:uncharacterized Tic20 family protein
LNRRRWRTSEGREERHHIIVLLVLLLLLLLVFDDDDVSFVIALLTVIIIIILSLMSHFLSSIGFPIRRNEGKQAREKKSSKIRIY